MQRIFTENVMTKEGKVKFPQGMVRDFPKPTWQSIEQTAGKSYEEFSEIPLESFHAQFVELPEKPLSERIAPSHKRGRAKLIRKEAV